MAAEMKGRGGRTESGPEAGRESKVASQGETRAGECVRGQLNPEPGGEAPSGTSVFVRVL
jgi:hypothetical protein